MTEFEVIIVIVIFLPKRSEPGKLVTSRTVAVQTFDFRLRLSTSYRSHPLKYSQWLGLATDPLHLLAMLHFSTGPVKGDFFTNTVKKACFA